MADFFSIKIWTGPMLEEPLHLTFFYWVFCCNIFVRLKGSLGRRQQVEHKAA